MKDKDFDLYRTSDGPVCITTPAHRRILDALKEGERSFGDVVEATGKAKSTVSIHLNRMAEEGLVSSREDEDDARRRWFSLEAEPILTGSPDLIDEAGSVDRLDPEGILTGLLGQMAGSGLSARPLFRLLGRDVGASLRTRTDKTPDEAADRAARYWTKWGLGDARIDGSRIRVEPAAWLTGPGLHPVELFQGLLEGIGGLEDVRIAEASETGFTLTTA